MCDNSNHDIINMHPKAFHFFVFLLAHKIVTFQSDQYISANLLRDIIFTLI